MITTSARPIASAVVLRVESEADIMNSNLMAPRWLRHYLLTQRVAGIKRHQCRASATGGCRS